MNRIIQIWILLNLGFSLCGQSKIRFEEVYSINPLSHNAVTCIHQDRLGFLWIGTFNGLNKYDGYSFKIYRFNENPPNTASTNRILSITEDRFGKLWIMSYDRWYHRFNPATETFLTFPEKSDTLESIRFNHFYESPDGTIALSSDRAGVYFISNAESDREVTVHHYYRERSESSLLTCNSINFVISDRHKHFWIGTQNGLNRVNGEEIGNGTLHIDRYYDTVGQDREKGVAFTKAIEHDGKIWFGTAENGLIWYSPEHQAFGSFSRDDPPGKYNSSEITAFCSRQEDLWIGTADGTLIKYDGVTEQFTSYPFTDNRSGVRIRKLYADHFNQVWILTDQFGITRFETSTGQYYYYRLTPPELMNLTDDERVTILEDSENQLWLGGQNIGIRHYDRTADEFKVYMNNPRDPYSLQSNVVECISEDREGNIWIGTNWFGKGLVRLITLDPAFEYIQPVSLPNDKIENVIRAILVDSRGNIWAGTKNGRIYIYDPEFRPLHVFEKDPSINFSGYNVYSIYQDEEGFMWLCTKGAGVYRSRQSLRSPTVSYAGLTFESIQPRPGTGMGLSNENVYDLVRDDLGRIWVATYGGGLNMLEPDGHGSYRFHHYTTENSSITSNKVRDLYLDSRGRLWLATVYGVNYADIYKPGGSSFTFRHLLSNRKDNSGLSYNDIVMIMEDRNGYIWLASAGGGVNKILNPGEEKFRIEYFSENEGIKDDYILGLAEDIYGFIWIGTASGLSRYNPVSGIIHNFDKKNGLPEVSFSERTAASMPSGKVLFGTMNGFYAILTDRIREENIKPGICLTGFQLNNSFVSPGEEGSPLDQSISYSDRIVLKSDQSNFSIEFSLLSFKSPESNHYEYILEGFSDEWVYIGTENRATFTNVPPGDYNFRVRGLNSDRSEYGTEVSLAIIVLPPVWKTRMAFLIYFVILTGLMFLVFRIARRFVSLRNNLRVEKRVAESKLRFFTNISHEFRTPLTLILGPLDNLISRKDIQTDVKQQLAVVHRNSKRLLRMVNQILDFRKVQNEKVQLRVQEILLIPFLRQIYESFENLAKQKNIRFNLIYNQQEEEMTLWGDIQKLDVVIFNLLSNAFKFTPENQQISIIVSHEYDGEESIRIKVADTGNGIEKDKLDLIFERFFVTHTSGDTDYQGTGIGLSLSKEYIRLHKGTIHVESDPGTGTEFTITLPAGKTHFDDGVIIKEREPYSYTPKIESAEELRNPAESASLVKPGSNGHYHILVVEDDLEMCRYLEQMLQPMYKIDIARDGADGWEKAQELTPDLILTDIMMPRMSGIELTRRIKEDFKTCHIPVIMLTSKSEVRSQIEGLQTGAEAYLPKPFQMELLLSYIQSFIAQREKIRALFDSRVELKPDEVQVTPKDKEFISRIIRIIDENLADPAFNVEKLASAVYISRTLFYKKIKGITGYQPVELIRMMRLKKAAQYIETGEFNISEVAYMVGYNDIRYFSTCFKKQFGVTPSQYQVR
ncbi:MAG: response regulator [Bacteroidales bacterium]|nr:response regulator [Bacteroidales bacterium]